MSRDKLILVGVVVLGILGALVYQQSKKDEAIGRPAVTATDFPTVSAPDDVDKISITNGDKGEVVLEKVPDPKGEPTDAGAATMWVLSKPVSAPANQQAIKDIIGNLKDVKVESQVNLKLDDDLALVAVGDAYLVDVVRGADGRQIGRGGRRAAEGFVLLGLLVDEGAEEPEDDDADE